jgi:hypothetical protein
MNTAVQLRCVAGDAPPSDLLHGTPGSIISGRLGPVALFSPGAIVVYRIRHRRRTRLFVFRTLEVDDRLAASIPGVHPRVQLLLDVRSAEHARLVRRLLGSLVKSGHDPCALPDAFYLRVGEALTGHLPPHKMVHSLLAASSGASGSPSSGSLTPPAFDKRFDKRPESHLPLSPSPLTSGLPVALSQASPAPGSAHSLTGARS